MAEAVHKTGNSVLIDTYAQKTALRLGVSPDSVRDEFGKIRRSEVGSRKPENEAGAVSESEVPRPSDNEFRLLKLLLQHDELVGWAALHLDANWIVHPLLRQIVEKRLAAQTNGTWKNLAAFLDECESSEMRSLITEAATTERKIPDPEKLFKGNSALSDKRGLLQQLRDEFIDRQFALVTSKLGKPETFEGEHVALMRQRDNLRQQKRTPLATLN